MIENGAMRDPRGPAYEYKEHPGTHRLRLGISDAVRIGSGQAMVVLEVQHQAGETGTVESHRVVIPMRWDSLSAYDDA